MGKGTGKHKYNEQGRGGMVHDSRRCQKERRAVKQSCKKAPMCHDVKKKRAGLTAQGAQRGGELGSVREKTPPADFLLTYCHAARWAGEEAAQRERGGGRRNFTSEKRKVSFPDLSLGEVPRFFWSVKSRGGESRWDIHLRGTAPFPEGDASKTGLAAASEKGAHQEGRVRKGSGRRG